MENSSATRIVQLTPEGRAAVAVLLVSGPRAAEEVSRHFIGHGNRPFADRPLNRILHGHWAGADGEDIVVCRSSGTEVEIHCHGGRAAIERIRDDLAAAGCESLLWPDWLRQRPSNRIRAAAATLLAKAATEQTAAILLDQYHGALNAALDEIISDIQASRIADAAAALDELLARAATGLHLVEPWRVVLAGPPNVGKSSLINAIVGYARSIVFDQPGTTRDVVTVATALDGWPMELSDTAGLRTSNEPLEQAGIALARRKTATADCVVLVFDANERSVADYEPLIGAFPKTIVVVNKTDLIPPADFQAISAACCGRAPLATSAHTGQGIDELASAIVRHLIPTPPQPGDAVPFMVDQAAQLAAAREALARGDVAMARQAVAAAQAN